MVRYMWVLFALHRRSGKVCLCGCFFSVRCCSLPALHEETEETLPAPIESLLAVVFDMVGFDERAHRPGARIRPGQGKAGWAFRLAGMAVRRYLEALVLTEGGSCITCGAALLFGRMHGERLVVSLKLLASAGA